MKLNNRVLLIGAVVVVAVAAFLLLNNEPVIETAGENPVSVESVPVQKNNSEATSFTGVGRLLTEEEIVQLESDLIEDVRVGSGRGQAARGNDEAQAHAPN